MSQDIYNLRSTQDVNMSLDRDISITIKNEITPFHENNENILSYKNRSSIQKSADLMLPPFNVNNTEVRQPMNNLTLSQDATFIAYQIERETKVNTDLDKLSLMPSQEFAKPMVSEDTILSTLPSAVFTQSPQSTCELPSDADSQPPGSQFTDINFSSQKEKLVELLLAASQESLSSQISFRSDMLSSQGSLASQDLVPVSPQNDAERIKRPQSPLVCNSDDSNSSLPPKLRHKSGKSYSMEAGSATTDRVIKRSQTPPLPKIDEDTVYDVCSDNSKSKQHEKNFPRTRSRKQKLTPIKTGVVEKLTKVSPRSIQTTMKKHWPSVGKPRSLFPKPSDDAMKSIKSERSDLLEDSSMIIDTDEDSDSEEMKQPVREPKRTRRSKTKVKIESKPITGDKTSEIVSNSEDDDDPEPESVAKKLKTTNKKSSPKPPTSKKRKSSGGRYRPSISELPEKKAERIRLKNKEAAKRSRDKKREKELALKAKSTKTKAELAEIEATYHSLRSQVLELMDKLYDQMKQPQFVYLEFPEWYKECRSQRNLAI